tara:strand:- start:730 stop:1005 length:276 start_codon:yes stop_codon:yes gene_type:complete
MSPQVTTVACVLGEGQARSLVIDQQRPRPFIGTAFAGETSVAAEQTIWEIKLAVHNVVNAKQDKNKKEIGPLFSMAVVLSPCNDSERENFV